MYNPDYRARIGTGDGLANGCDAGRVVGDGALM